MHCGPRPCSLLTLPCCRCRCRCYNSLLLLPLPLPAAVQVEVYEAAGSRYAELPSELYGVALAYIAEAASRGQPVLLEKAVAALAAASAAVPPGAHGHVGDAGSLQWAGWQSALGCPCQLPGTLVCSPGHPGPAMRLLVHAGFAHFSIGPGK